MARTVVIADAHARPYLITNALESAKDWDRLVFAGDFLDIGPEPGVCLGLLRNAGAEMLWGNHELAILLGQQVKPQSRESWSFRTLLGAMAFEWPVATIADGVLISHAGFGEFYRRQLERLGSLEALVEHENEDFRHILNSEAVKDQFWENISPLWFRPDNLLKPLDGVLQVVGHTPPEALPPGLEEDGYVSVDPYTTGPWDEGRYRYAVIENGTITIHDSNVADSDNIASGG